MNSMLTLESCSYAWDYLRWWIKRYPELLCNINCKSLTLPSESLVVFIRTWCLQSPSDTSGWSFLLSILVSPMQAPDVLIATFKFVLDTAVALRLRNESLWFFLRSLTASEHLDSNLQRAYRTQIASMVTSDNERSNHKLMAQAILKSLTAAPY